MSSQADSNQERQVKPRPDCGVCGQAFWTEHGGIPLCRDHSAVDYRLGKLREAQTDPAVDLTGKRSQGPRDSHDGGFRRPFDVVPEDSLERVTRDVTATFGSVPMWGVEALFERLHKELGKPDIDEVGAQLVVKYSGLDEEQYAQLFLLREHWDFGMNLEIDVTQTRLYVPREQAEQRMKEVEKERSEAQE